MQQTCCDFSAWWPTQRKVHHRCKDRSARFWFLEEKMFDIENPLGQANVVKFDGRIYA